MNKLLGGCCAGFILGFGLSTYLGPVINDVNYYELSNGPKIRHIDVSWGEDQVDVQNPNGEYTSLAFYLKNHVDKQDRAVQKALIERMVDTKGEETPLD